MAENFLVLVFIAMHTRLAADVIVQPMDHSGLPEDAAHWQAFVSDKGNSARLPRLKRSSENSRSIGGLHTLGACSPVMTVHLPLRC